MSGPFPILYIAEADGEAAVLSSGVLACLVEQMPRATFTVVGSATSAPLFADTPRLDRLIVLDGEKAFDWLKLWTEVRSTRWGLIVDLRGGPVSDKLRRRKRAVRTPDPEPLHSVVSAARVLQLEVPPAPHLFFGKATLAAADALVRPDHRPILAIGPGVEWIGCRWPAERFAKVAANLLADDGLMAGGRLLIVGEEADRDAAHSIRLATSRDRTIEAQGKLTRLETAAALSRATLYIGADSIWTQLAVAAGAPSVAVYGPSDETRTGPWGGEAVRGPRSLEEFRALDPGLNQAIQHMMDLPAERVLQVARNLLSRSLFVRSRQ